MTLHRKGETAQPTEADRQQSTQRKLDALKKLMDVLEPLTADERHGVLHCSTVFYGIDLPSRY